MSQKMISKMHSFLKIWHQYFFLLDMPIKIIKFERIWLHGIELELIICLSPDQVRVRCPGPVDLNLMLILGVKLRNLPSDEHQYCSFSAKFFERR